MEADLQAHYNTDIRDRWVRGPHRLTLRRIGVLVRHLPSEAETVRIFNDGETPWTRLEHLTADVWQAAAQSKKPHPARPDPARKRRERSLSEPRTRRAFESLQRRRAKRAEQIAAGEIT